jgi:hypothetical protein
LYKRDNMYDAGQVNMYYHLNHQQDGKASLS